MRRITDDNVYLRTRPDTGAPAVAQVHRDTVLRTAGCDVGGGTYPPACGYPDPADVWAVLDWNGQVVYAAQVCVVLAG